jgi:hypothetical protein
VQRKNNSLKDFGFRDLLRWLPARYGNLLGMRLSAAEAGLTAGER